VRIWVERTRSVLDPAYESTTFLQTHSFYPSSSERRNGVDGWIEEDGDVRSQRPDLKKRASVGGTGFSASLVIRRSHREGGKMVEV